jgi:hypothetical protein
MKNLQVVTLLLFISLMSFAQNDGITYQAVIIGPYALELPGVNSENNIFPNETVAIRFSIFDQNDVEIFQEIQITETDDFGRVNLLIGAVNNDAFTKISWDGNNKDLRVEIDFEGGSNFVNMSRNGLTFLPYAYHRNITATGTLKVDDDTFLNGQLTVALPTNLNSTLAVKNATTLSGDLTTDGVTNLNNSLDVNNKSTTTLTGDLNVGEVTGNADNDAATILNGSLNVVGLTTVTDLKATGEADFNELNTNTLSVLESSSLMGVTSIAGTNTITGENNIGTMLDSTFVKGKLTIASNEQIKITSTLIGSDIDINSHPVLIEGGSQGLAIKVNQGRDNSTNFITFFDTTRDEPWGRIEGEIPSQFTNNDDYNFDIRSLDYDVYDAELDLGWALVDVGILVVKVIATSTDFRPCVGFGVCAVSPGPTLIAQVIAEAVVVGLQVGFATDAKAKATANKDLYHANTKKNQGVTYASGAGDYAEYLLRADVNESMSYGDIVGVKGGAISKNVQDAERMMVVSYKPIVLGNMPQPNQEKDYEKVAFMGQVPVKVIGKVNIGDYIVPSGNNDGLGKAVASEKISIKNIKNIIGIAWEATERENGFKFINVAVGINNNDNNRILQKLEERVLKQDNELNQLKNILEETINRLVVLENKPNTDNLNNTISHNDEDGHTGVSSDGRKYVKENGMIYYEITDADIERGFSYAEKMMQESGFDTAIYSAWKKLKEDSSFKLNLSNSLKEKFEKQVHYHKEISKKSGN